MKSVDRIKQTGEVFTPDELIEEILNKLPSEVWTDKSKTWLEPSAGDGNFLVAIKERLLAAGHDEKHILDNMIFSIELIDDNHWVLQHRLGYLVDGKPNPKFWPNGENFVISKIHPQTQDLNDKNPYHENLGLARDEVYHHRNHVCWSALDYDMSFGRDDEGKSVMPAPAPNHRSKTKVFECKWKMIDDSPEKGVAIPGKHFIYGLFIDGKIFYVGESNNVRKRANFYADAVRFNVVDKASSTKHLQQLASEGKSADFEIDVLEIVNKGEELEAEDRWMKDLRSAGETLVNKTKPMKEKVVKQPKAPRQKKEPSPDAKGGGWQVKAEWIGKGMKVRSKAPFDGSFWECDHDELVSRINESLASKGKTKIGEPGPSEKQYGASSGLRHQEIWTRVS